MASADCTIAQLILLHDRLVRIAYNANGKSDAVLTELASVAKAKEAILSEYEESIPAVAKR